MRERPGEAAEPKAPSKRRKAQLAAAQDRRRGRLDREGFKLVQGFVPLEYRKKLAALKAPLDARTMGGVLMKLYDYWEASNGGKPKRAASKSR